MKTTIGVISTANEDDGSCNTKAIVQSYGKAVQDLEIALRQDNVEELAQYEDAVDQAFMDLINCPIDTEDNTHRLIEKLLDIVAEMEADSKLGRQASERLSAIFSQLLERSSK